MPRSIWKGSPYYLAPQKGSNHAYALLRAALKESGRVGIAKIIIRDAQHLAAVEVIDDALVLTMLRYADELVDTAQMEFPSVERVRKAELDMAKMLIENLAAEWDPSKYTDEYRDNLMKLIKGRIKGERPRLPSAEPAPERKVVDLMERLRQSLAQNQKPASRAKSAKRAHPAAKGSGRKKARPAA
jgi:DNA end-binding protein Ku